MRSSDTLDNMLYCLRFTRKCLPALLGWCGLSVAMKVVLPVLEMYLPKVVIARIEMGQSLERLVTPVLLMTGAIAVITGLAKLAEKQVYHNKLLMGDYYLRQIADKGLRTDYENLEKSDFKELQMGSFYAVSGNESTLRNVYYSWIGLISGIIGFLFYLVVLTDMHPAVMAFLAAGAVAGFLLSDRANRWLAVNQGERSRYYHRLGYIQTASGDVRSAKDIRLYRLEEWLQSVYNENLGKINRWYRKYGRVVFKTSLGSASISLVREGLAYGYLLYLVYKGHIGASDFVLYFAAITGFSGWLQNILQEITKLKKCSIAVGTLRRYLTYPERFRREGGRPIPEGAPRTIELRHVSYRYMGAAHDTLQDLNLIITPGEHLGVVGLNGAGKTTMMKLISGLCDPTEGEVLYDGVNIKEYDREAYYRKIAAVFQQYSVLPVSVEDIVKEHGESGRTVEYCLRTANLWDKIQSLPKGLETMVDPAINEEGISFSGGETQKLLLARAIYKDAPLLILDEPTAALDPLSENRLYETYHTITEGKTSIFISHRLASTRFCSRILLMNRGRIEEEGTHEELLLKKGRYYKMFQTQARYYQEHPEEVSESV